MAIQVNTIGIGKIRGLIRANKINTNNSWSFTASDGNKLLGANGNDWENFADHHLTIDTEETTDTKNYWKFPVAKDGVIYRSGLIAAKQRATQQGYDNIEEIADELLQMVDEKTELKWHKKLFNQLRELIKPQSEQKAVKQTGGFFVRKQLDGTYRWVGIVTNNFKDRDGDILTDSAHIEFLNYLDANPKKAPELWTWHIPGTARKSKADWWEYANGFFIYSGELTPEEGVFYEHVTDEVIGMSHGFFVLGKEGKLITKYRTFEVSELPIDVAANPFTFFDVENTMEVKMAFSERKRQYLSERFGDERVAQLEGIPEEAEKALEAIGIERKQLNDEYEAHIEQKLVERVQTAAEPQVAKIVKAVVKALRDDLVTLNERIGGLDEQIKTASKLEETVNEITEKVNHLMETKDTWIADALSAGNPFVDSPTKSNQNTISEEDLESDLLAKVKEAAADEGWLQNMSPFDGGTQ